MAAARPDNSPNPSAAHGYDEKKGELDIGQQEDVVVVRDNADQLQRHLGNRQIQLIAVGGSIGTALFVSIGTGLTRGGPGSLFIGYTIYAMFLGMVNNGMAEMCVYMPVSSSFLRMAGKWVDESFGFMAGWNFFLYEAFLIPFEISALNLVITFWTDKVPVAAICVGCIILYALINVLAVKFYGEAEFWLASGKLVLIGIVFSFTLVTMCGGNPQNDAYGFRYWNNPGAFAEYIGGGALGRFTGFLAAVYSAGFTVVGPEYLAMVAGETQRPRTYLKQGFKTVYWRFGFFFIGGALAVSIILPYNNERLRNNNSGTADGSPYVIAMQNMGVAVLPSVVNALLCTSIFSAGNAYTYCAMRSLYGLALDGHAPAIFKKCLKNGIPIYAFAVVMVFPFLSFLQVSANAAKVVTWLATLTQGAQMINYMIMSITYIFFHKALKAQNISRDTLPYKGWFQPYCAWAGLAWMTFVELTYGYTSFVPGFNDGVGTFFSYYTMLIIDIVTYSFWKLWKRTKVIPAADADLIWDKPIIDQYEATLIEPPTRFRDDVLSMFRGKKKRDNSLGEDPN
ncbi:hypothetical protein DL765_004373 [Monosporascus sp. GIB2]|nr:hypothetical protein DL765_004373 [Monosporascus sp. GIB2]